MPPKDSFLACGSRGTTAYIGEVHGIDPKLLLITLLIKLGVAAALASSLARSVRFKRLLLLQERSSADVLKMLAWICVPLALGVWIRVRVPNFLAADLSLQTTALLGLLLGSGPAALGGTVLALPALGHHEWLALPVNIVFACLFGGFRRFATEDAIWSFSPLIDLSIYRWVRRNLRQPRLDRQIALLLLLMATQLAASLLVDMQPRHYFELSSTNWLLELLVCACTPVIVGIPLKIWNAVRIERKLEEQGRLLLEARLDALQRQINPHFLFNTLNSIASLIRSEPELAREMIVKLSRILRTLLRERDAFVSLEDELAFTDDYLDIEVIRFGQKLRVVKEITEEALPLEVPSMLLQPLIENSIKHGLEPRIGGGTVTVRGRVFSGKLLLEVEDDGVGIDPERTSRAVESGLGKEGMGIGMRNVRERMQVLYEGGADVEVESRPGRGTRIRLVLPALTRHDVELRRVRPFDAV
ncbi:MAG: sensor histidine kinase [Janthinobacterium lividum]